MDNLSCHKCEKIAKELTVNRLFITSGEYHTELCINNFTRANSCAHTNINLRRINKARLVNGHDIVRLYNNIPNILSAKKSAL